MRKIFIFVIFSSLFSSVLQAHGPTRQQVIESVEINAPVEKVWELVGDFSAMHKWHPAIQSTEMKGDTVRVLSLGNDKEITEKLVRRDEKKMKLKYKITDMTVLDTFEFAGLKVERKLLPVNTYTGFLYVTSEGRGSKVTWKGKFYRSYMLNPPTPEGMSDKDAIATMTSVYQEGLDNLKRLLEKSDGDKSSIARSPRTPRPPATPDEPMARLTPLPALTPIPSLAPKSKGAFDVDDPYSDHVQCKPGEKCKIDKFLLNGFRAFSQCQVCHGIDGNGSTIAPSLLDKLKSEVTYDIFIDRVSNGFKGQLGVMPPWGTNPNIMKKIDNLYAYLKARSDGIIPAGRLKKFKHKK